MSIGGPGSSNDLTPQGFLSAKMEDQNHILEDGLVVCNSEIYGKSVYLVNLQNKVFSIDVSQKQDPVYANAIKRTKAIVTGLTSRVASPVPSTSGLASVQPLAHSSRTGVNSVQYLQNKAALPNHKIESGLLVSDSDYGKFVYLVSDDNKVFSVVYGEEQLPENAKFLRRTKDSVQQAVRSSAVIPSNTHTEISGSMTRMSIAGSSGLTAQDKVVGEYGKAKLVKDDDIFSFLKKINAPHVLVNAANNKMEHSGGIAGVIAEQAGSDMARECGDTLAQGPVSAGDVLWSGAHDLKLSYQTSAVAHAVGPNVNPRNRYSPDPSMNQQRQRELLVQCYAGTVVAAGMKNAAQPVVFPPLSAFNFGVDIELSIAAFKEGVKNAENTLQAMGVGCPDVYLVLAEKYDSSSAIAQAEHAFSSSGTVASRTPSPQNIPGPSWRGAGMTEQPARSQLPELYQRRADETERVIFEDDIPANIREELKELLESGIFFLTAEETIKALSNDIIDPVTQLPLNQYKEGEVVSYLANNHPRLISIEGLLNLLRREGTFKCPVTTEMIVSGFTCDLANHDPVPDNWFNY